MGWAPDYSTTARVKNYLRIDDTDDDVFIAAWLTAVSRNIDDHCGRQFGGVDVAEERVYVPEPLYGRGVGNAYPSVGYVYQIDDLFDTAGMTVVDGNGAAVADYELWPLNAPAKGKPYTQLRAGRSCRGGRITAEALWGWATPPASIEVGIWLQAARLAARRDSPFGIAGSPSEGSELRLLAQLDPDFRTTLKPFVRKWWAA